MRSPRQQAAQTQIRQIRIYPILAGTLKHQRQKPATNKSQRNIVATTFTGSFSSNKDKPKMAFLKLCDTCGKIFHNKSSYHRHRRQHVNPDKFACDDCHEEYTRKDALVRHKKTHRLSKSTPQNKPEQTRADNVDLQTSTPCYNDQEVSPSNWDGSTDFLDIMLQELTQTGPTINQEDNLTVVPTKTSWRANTPPPEMAGTKRKYHTGATLDAAAYTLHHLKKYRSSKLFFFPTMK